MIENTGVTQAVEVIMVLTRDDIELGAQAFKNWRELAKDPSTGELLDPAQCVALARQQLLAKQGQ